MNPLPLKRLLGVPAPAKLNLFLHITGQRPDGYHLLESVFMLIDWCDILHLELRPDGRITREDLGPGAPLPAHDLSVRAAQLLQQTTGCPLGVHIGLEKNLPSQAGLGGGSSDAASCLLALNRLWGLGLSRPQLAALGLQLGADVPFFIVGHHAWVRGIGEQISPIQLAPAELVVLKPPQGASTPAVFSAPLLKRNTPALRTPPWVAAPAAAHSVQSILELGHNDLQPVVERLCPQVRHGIEHLARSGLSGRMSGSGTALFALTPPQRTTCPAPANWLIKNCNNIPHHPLIDWC